jgi:hypothetical protein
MNPIIFAVLAALSFGIFMLLAAFGAGLGVLSSFIAVGRYLKV